MSKPHLPIAQNTTPELEAYILRSESKIVFVALLTLWIVLIPFSSFGTDTTALMASLLTKLAVSFVFAVDMFRRARLAPQPWTYVWAHPIGLLAIGFPPIRVLFSIRLVTSLFRRGHLAKFLAADFVLLVNGALLVYFYERDSAGANITSLGDAAWWAIVTVTTVGYGDLYPVTAPGQIAAACVMCIGILTLAVITAQVSWSFSQQVDDRTRGSRSETLEPEAVAVGTILPTSDLEGLHGRLDGIEAQLKRLIHQYDPPHEQQLDAAPEPEGM